VDLFSIPIPLGSETSAGVSGTRIERDKSLSNKRKFDDET